MHEYYEVAPDLTVYCQEDCHTDPWGPEPETIVLVHGAGESSDAWFAWLPHLTRHYRVFRPDLRGHGKTTRPEPGFPWSPARLADDLLGLLDRLGVGRVHLIGAKVGGSTVLEASVKAPERIISTTAIGPLIHWNEARTAPREVDYTPGTFETWVANSMRARLGTRTPQAQIDYWIEWSLRQSVSPTRVEILLSMGKADLREIFPKITVPTLLVNAEHSPILPTEMVRAFVDLLPDGELLVVGGDGYHVAAATPDECAIGVRRFVERHSERPVMAAGQK